MSVRCKFFLDPMQVINNYKACQLNEKHSKVVGYGNLETVYCYVTGEQKLEGAHSSIVDDKGQCQVVTDARFKTFIDKPMSKRYSFCTKMASKEKGKEGRWEPIYSSS